MTTAAQGERYEMSFLEKEAFAFDLLNDLTDNHGFTDHTGTVARRIQETTSDAEMDNLIVWLKSNLVVAMRPLY